MSVNTNSDSWITEKADNGLRSFKKRVSEVNFPLAAFVENEPNTARPLLVPCRYCGYAIRTHIKNTHIVWGWNMLTHAHPSNVPHFEFNLNFLVNFDSQISTFHAETGITTDGTPREWRKHCNYSCLSARAAPNQVTKVTLIFY